jgi:hypothetical protein
VKEPLKAPFLYLAFLLGTLVILGGLNVCWTWGMFDSATRAFTLGWAARRFPRSLFEVMIPSVIISIVMLGMRMTRKPFSRLLGLLIVLAVGYTTLVNGMIWFRNLGARSTPAPEVPLQYLQPSTFLRVGDSIVNARSISGAVLKGVLLVDPGATQSRLAVYPAATASARAGTLSVTPVGQPQRRVSGSPELAGAGIFAPDRITAFFLRDVHTLNADFEALLRGSLPEFFAACFAFVFVCAASLALLRLTRWPLLNLMILVAAIRGLFSLYHLLAVTLAPQISAMLTDRLVARLLPSASLAVIGVLLLLIDIIFIPADRWTKVEPL